MRFGWRAISGPVLTAAITLLAILFDRAVPLPSLTPVFVCVVALAGALSGFAFARERHLDSFAAERQSHATAARLSAALDQVDIGIVLLDAETRAEFINRAFRDYFALPDEKADEKPPFIALMYHGRDTDAFDLPEDELGLFIAQRIEMVRIGDATPINIALRNGEVLRFVCTALPDGGRMLSYTPVTDLVRHTDAPARADYYRSLRDPASRKLIRYLRVAE